MIARFDDVVEDVGLAFGPPVRTLISRTPDEVVPVLAEVDAATRQGGWAVGFVAYEAASALDPSLTTGRPVEGLPLAWFALTDAPARGRAVAPPAGVERGYSLASWRPSWTSDGYRADVERVREHIGAGDIFQCNLTSRLRSSASGDLGELYVDLVHNQRTRYGAYLETGGHVVASASPELFFEWADDRLLTRPMKGTAPRGRTAAEDEQAVAALVGSDKERAENTIVVDLLRNDVSRVAEIGSVTTPALCTPEKYETVWQLTSDVDGRVSPSTPLVEVFRALFPSGSVTGAPKPRAMQIIADLEGSPRGVYCGAIGWVAPPSEPVRARFSVGIRTGVVDCSDGSITYGTGSGITWSSDPAAELAELSAKTAILHAPRRKLLSAEAVAHETERFDFRRARPNSERRS